MQTEREQSSTSRHIQQPEQAHVEDCDREGSRVHENAGVDEVNQAQEGEREGSWFSGFLASVVRMIVIYFIFSSIVRYFAPQSQGTNTTGVQTGNDQGNGINTQTLKPLFYPNQKMFFQVYLSEEKEINRNTEKVIWKEEGIYLNSHAQNNRYLNITFSSSSFPEHYHKLISNGTLYIHIFVEKQRHHIAENPSSFPDKVHHISYMLNKYLKIKKDRKINLLADNHPSSENNVTQEDNMIQYGSYWSSDLNIVMSDFSDVISNGFIPIHMQPVIKVTENQRYFPLIYVNDFWNIKENMLILNDTLKEIPLRLSFEYLPQWKLHLYLQMQASFDMQKSWGSLVDEQQDEFKRIILETNPYLLGITIVVSLLHSLFDFLAFKNDISFWRNKKSMEGLSVKTLMINIVCQFVIILYLFDNETNWLILLSTCVGLVIEIWKLKKAVHLRVSPQFPYISIQNKSSYSSKTKEYDDEAMKYLFYGCMPLMVGYTIYSMVYDTHKSWYSFVISTAVGFIYTFGFIMMTPQLFINYKLKSVAHMPWKTFMYKALNTFVDDLFSFVIKMPTLHRLSCFRDDIIFLIYLYQRWIYKVDKKRVNEYGQGGEDDSEDTTPKDKTDKQTNKKSRGEKEKTE